MKALGLNAKNTGPSFVRLNGVESAIASDIKDAFSIQILGEHLLNMLPRPQWMIRRLTKTALLFCREAVRKFNFMEPWPELLNACGDL
jgi:hypothetical protein